MALTNKEAALQAHQKRVILERDALSNKMERLKNFLDDDEKTDMLDPMERTDMILQLGVMNQYHGILCNRIRRF